MKRLANVLTGFVALSHVGGCVIVAGVFGGITARTSILLTQALSAVLAVVAVRLASRKDGEAQGRSRS